MSKIRLIVLLYLMSGRGFAQEHFVLIQTDNHQPFFARIGEKTYSSSTSGHLILSQLKDSTYTISVGFPKSPLPSERIFSFRMDGRDEDFLIKDIGEKGWGLVNVRTQELKMAERTEDTVIKKPPEGVRMDDAFSRLMAGVVGDTTVMYNTYALEEASKKEGAGEKILAPPKDSTNAGGVGTADSAGLVATGPKASPEVAKKTKVRPAPHPLAIKGPLIRKLGERKTARSLRLVYIVRSPGVKADTVVLIIPVDSVSHIASRPADSPQKPPVLVSVPGSDTAPKITAVEPVAADQGRNSAEQSKSVPEQSRNGTEQVRNKPDSGQKKTASRIILVNSDCKGFATDYDVDKLRVRMLETPKDEDRIVLAKKVFRTRCFSTKQIKALSEVFATDALKYKFLEAALPAISDDRFRELSDLLADPVYNGKFKAMVNPGGPR